MKINTLQIADGIKIIHIPSTQYKTNLVSVYIKRPLRRDEVTKNSLLPYVLRSGSAQLDTQAKIVNALQLLYGASLSVGVSKAGEKQILSFKLAVTDEKYLGECISEQALDILMGVLFEPYLEQGAFREKTVALEKEALSEAILSKINNKAAYAMERLIENMCADEPFGIPEDGYIDALATIDAQELYAYYQKVIRESEIDIAVTGEMDLQLLELQLKKHLGSKRGDILRTERERIHVEPSRVKEIIEHSQINQGKLALGYRTNIAVEDRLNFAMTLYAVILGGGTSSKLFMNVREKHSLSYSIGAGLERMKSLLFIQAGIETTELERAKKLIFSEVEDMRNGVISAQELEHAKKHVVNQIRSMKDSVWAVSDYIYMLSLQGMNETPESVIEKIKAVTLEEVVEAARKIKLDTIYFLTNNEVQNENQA